jgi:hypothetical protein
MIIVDVDVDDDNDKRAEHALTGRLAVGFGLGGGGPSDTYAIPLLARE